MCAVRFRSGAPSVQRIEHFGPNEEMPVRFRPPVPVRVGVAQLDESAGFRSPRPLVRFQPLTPDFQFRGLGKRINPLGLGPRESRFESEVPDQFLWGSQAVTQMAVNQLMRRFEPCPHSQERRDAFWSRAPLLQRGAVEFDPLPRYQKNFASASTQTHAGFVYGADADINLRATSLCASRRHRKAASLSSRQREGFKITMGTMIEER